MLKINDRFYIVKDINVPGVKVGTNATLIDMFPGELYPIQLRLDVPDDDGHPIYRVRYDEIKPILEENKAEEMHVILPNTDGELPI